ncbi:endonuclease [Euzebyella marina]|uniref:Endonuclease n=1 Tax=Euzebyella marina TaxID=1761453 RepID=A0A3G2L1U0_9FLAO|nr:endonuclease/exonuclease/phosphatase family protein [Euzebyella marina]AYN66176.1 endonuclease [Euzebyella marina]
MNFSLTKRPKNKHLYTIAFYNLENLFDTADDIRTLDDDFTPKGFKKWTHKRYKKKLNKLSKTIAKLGHYETDLPPTLVGVSEVENHHVVKDLLASGPLRNFDYSYVHFNSPDERGIDCALIYDRKHFEVEFSEPIQVLVFEENGIRDTTRDILYVKGKLKNETVHIFVNHWPSRRDGDSKTAHKRITAAKTINDFMMGIETSEANPNYIVMGDFNDDPQSESVKFLTETKGLYNPMEKLITPTRGSASYRLSWMLFDQIIVSHTFLNYEKGTHSFAHANIFDKHFLKEFKGKYKGSPFRTYVGRKYLGGYSDHFPVYIQLKYNS